MKREHLIVIAVVVFVLVGCAVAAFAGLLIFDSDPSIDPVDGTDQSWTPPDVPQTTIDPPTQSYTQPRTDGTSPTPMRSQSALDFLPGVWQCVQSSTIVGEGTILQFMQSPGGAAGVAYMTTDPKGESGWTELNYQLGVEGYLTVYASQVPEGRTPVTSRFWIQFPDETTMLMYSAEPGDESLAPAVMYRVQ